MTITAHAPNPLEIFEVPSSPSYWGPPRPKHPVEHPNRLMCGYYVLAYVLSSLGLDTDGIIPQPRKGLGKFKPQGITPKKMAGLLKKYGINSKVIQFSDDNEFNRTDHIWSLKEKLSREEPVLILVYGGFRLAPHWIVLCGHDPRGGIFYAYDPRTWFGYGKAGTTSSEDPELPIGNRALTARELLSLWSCRCLFNLFGLCGFRKFRYVAVMLT